jgi:hypothetical protein
MAWRRRAVETGERRSRRCLGRVRVDWKLDRTGQPPRQSDLESFKEFIGPAPGPELGAATSARTEPSVGRGRNAWQRAV